jgi:hypothetical protein
MRPRCIVVPPDSARPLWSVWLSDCLHPGQHLTDASTREEADDLCVKLALHYKVKALPMGTSDSGGEES